MARAVDHLVVPSTDLSGLAQAFHELGFTVGSRNRHPWGTENHVIQFRSSFFELIGFATGFVPLQPRDAAYPFADFVARWLDRDLAGVAMTVLRSSDAVGDAASFEAAGIGTQRLLPFSRSAQAPDGTDKTVAFTVAFAEAATMPDIGFFTCQQHRPENFWNPAVQSHPNGAGELTGFVIVAADPQEHASFLMSFSEGALTASSAEAVEITLPGGRIEVVTPARFGERYGTTPPAERDEPWIGAVLVSTSTTHRTKGWLLSAGFAVQTHGDRLVLHPPALGDCRLIFEP